MSSGQNLEHYLKKHVYIYMQFITKQVFHAYSLSRQPLIRKFKLGPKIRLRPYGIRLHGDGATSSTTLKNRSSDILVNLSVINYNTCMVTCKLKIKIFNPYKPGVLFIGHRQTE